jgi:uncharacterized protein YndB with AHSA1/START domain
MISFHTGVRIERPLAEVFAYVSDPLSFPDWNSAVQGMHLTSQGANAEGSTYAMERQLPSGRATNELEIVTLREPEEFAIRATAGPTPFAYRYRFAAENGATVIHLEAELELTGIGAVMPSLAGRAVKRGVDDNLATLKRTLEARAG